MITSEPSVSFIIAVVGYRFEPEVSHLQSLKVGVWNKFLTPTNSHLIRFPTTAIIETRSSFVIIYFFSAKKSFLRQPDSGGGKETVITPNPCGFSVINISVASSTNI